MATESVAPNSRPALYRANDTQRAEPNGSRNADAPGTAPASHLRSDHMAPAGAHATAVSTRHAAPTLVPAGATPTARQAGRHPVAQRLAGVRPGHMAGQAAALLGLLVTLPAAVASRLAPALAPALGDLPASAAQEPAPELAPVFDTNPDAWGRIDPATWASFQASRAAAAAAAAAAASDESGYPEPGPAYPSSGLSFPVLVGTLVTGIFVIGGLALILSRRHRGTQDQVGAGSRSAASTQALPTIHEASVHTAGGVALGVQNDGPSVVVVHPAAI